MKRTRLETADQALSFYRQVDDDTAKSILDFLIDHPDERFEGADLVRQLGLDEHRVVARSTYRMGQIAADFGLHRPWTEAQRGYLMPGEQARLLRQAREQSAAATSF
ncbi:MAG: hypothetical protein R3A46_06140 [Thermomicrobiales bacterium]